MPDHVVLGEPEHAGAGRIAGGDPARLVEREHPVRHALEHGVGVVLHRLHLVEELGVLERDRLLGRDRAQPLLVVLGERAAALVEDLGDADGVARLGHDGDAEDGPREVAGLAVERRVEPQVGVRVGDVDRLAGGEHRARDADVVGKADLAHAVAFGHAGEQLVGAVVVEEERRPVGVEDAGGLADDPLEQRAEVELRGDVGHEVEELALLRLALLHRLYVAAVHQRDRGLRGHGLEEPEVVVGEVAAALVEDLGDSDDGAPGGAHGRARDVARVVAGLLVDGAVERGIVVRVVHDDAHAAVEHPPGDAVVVEEADLARPLSLGDAGVELSCRGVAEEQGAAVGVGLLRDERDERGQDLVEAVGRGHGAGDVHQRLGQPQPLQLVVREARAVCLGLLRVRTHLDSSSRVRRVVIVVVSWARSSAKARSAAARSSTWACACSSSRARSRSARSRRAAISSVAAWTAAWISSERSAAWASSASRSASIMARSSRTVGSGSASTAGSVSGTRGAPGGFTRGTLVPLHPNCPPTPPVPPYPGRCTDPSASRRQWGLWATSHG